MGVDPCVTKKSVRSFDSDCFVKLAMVTRVLNWFILKIFRVLHVIFVERDLSVSVVCLRAPRRCPHGVKFSSVKMIFSYTKLITQNSLSFLDFTYSWQNDENCIPGYR